jgi:alkylhydroperoxidase family enzyme
VRQLPEFRTSELFDERERVAFELAERMTITGQRVDDELFESVRKHFSEDETVELVAIAGYENMRSKMNVALGIEAQGFCVIGAKR